MADRGATGSYRAPGLPPAGHNGDGGADNHRHNTIRLTATVYYPFHPLHGRELRVTSRPRNPGLPVTVVDEAGAVLRIPAWMLAPEAVHYQLATQATLDAQTLRALAALLMSLLDDGREGGEGLRKPWKGERP